MRINLSLDNLEVETKRGTDPIIIGHFQLDYTPLNLDWQLLLTEQQSGQGLGLSNNSVLTAWIIFQTYRRWNQ